MVDQDWPATDYAPIRTCPSCGAVMRAAGHQDIESLRSWEYLPVDCNCFTSVGCSEALPKGTKGKPVHKPKQVLGVWKQETAFESLYFRIGLAMAPATKRYEVIKGIGFAVAINAKGAERNDVVDVNARGTAFTTSPAIPLEGLPALGLPVGTTLLLRYPVHVLRVIRSDAMFVAALARTVFSSADSAPFAFWNIKRTKAIQADAVDNLIARTFFYRCVLARLRAIFSASVLLSCSTSGEELTAMPTLDFYLRGNLTSVWWLSPAIGYCLAVIGAVFSSLSPVWLDLESATTNSAEYGNHAANSTSDGGLMQLFQAEKKAPLLLTAGKKQTDRKYRVIQDDVLNFCKDYRGPKAHALLCDPPYHLTSITERFGDKNAKPAKFGKDGAFARASRGFMGTTWDGGDTAFDPETWSALGEHLYPGAFGMAFASSRGWHRLAVAIEDAGFIIHPSIFGWGQAQGFPKATRIDRQIDRDRDLKGTMGDYKTPDHAIKRKPGNQRMHEGYQRPWRDDPEAEDRNSREYIGADELSQAWSGHRYGLQALRPSLEPIIVFQKPYEGRPVDCITATGAGALWIDGGRIPGQPETTRFDPAKHKHDGYRMTATGEDIAQNEVGGRWPANLALIHDPRCNGTCVPECSVRRLGEQSGERGAGGNIVNAQSEPATNVYFGRFDRVSWEGHDDSGTAARFFYNADWSHEVAEQIANADPVRYVAKASTEERSLGLESLPFQTVGDGRLTPIDNAYQRGETERRNTHPTVKPIALTEWLAKLLLPPAAYGPRRLLVPFSGSGSEMIGALLAGWEQIIGIEMTMEYAQIARARLAYYADPLRTMRTPAEPTPQFIQQQVSLFDLPEVATATQQVNLRVAEQLAMEGLFA